MSKVPALLLLVLAGCAVVREPTEQGDEYLARLADLRAYALSVEDTADSLLAAAAWGRLVSAATHPPRLIGTVQQRSACAYALQAHLRQRALEGDYLTAHRGRGDHVEFYRGETRITEPDSAWEAAERSLECPRTAR